MSDVLDHAENPEFMTKTILHFSGNYKSPNSTDTFATRFKEYTNEHCNIHEQRRKPLFTRNTKCIVVMLSIRFEALNHFELLFLDHVSFMTIVFTRASLIPEAPFAKTLLIPTHSENKPRTTHETSLFMERSKARPCSLCL